MPIIITLIIILIILLAITGLIIYIKRTISNFSQKYFGTSDLKEAIDKSELTASETPKTVYSVQSVFERQTYKDFPGISISTLKAETESAIREIFKGIEEKNPKISKNEYINKYIADKIEKNKEISFEDLKFHNTVINMYNRNSIEATITMQSSFEYWKITNNKRKKIQDRLKISFIYVIDENAFGEGIRALSLKCPNCGAPIKIVGENKYCEYCGAGVKEIAVTKVWILNRIKQD